MIYRVRDPPTVNTSSTLGAQSLSQTPTASKLRSPTPEASEGENESTEIVPRVDPPQVVARKRYNNLPRQLSYIESTDDPFEEIVFRAETYFPGLTNIVADQSGSYIVEQTACDSTPQPSKPSLPSVPLPIGQHKQQQHPINSSNTRQNPFNTSIAESKRRGEEELDRRIMMYSRANRNPHNYYSYSFHGGSHQQSLQVHRQIIPCGNYLPQQPLNANNNTFQAPCTSDLDMDERTTYDYRDFQAARQRFEQRVPISQTAPPAPKNHFYRSDLRSQHSTTSTVMPNESKCNAAVGSLCQMNAPYAHRPPPFHATFNSQPSVSHENSALVRRDPRNLFSGGCGCGPGAGCGALPDTPIHRNQGNHQEAISKYLVAEEMGPGGVKSVFSFPGGMEPSDLTLLRAAISANQPKDSFIPEENDDLEEQLNLQLERACVDPQSLQLLHNQAPLQSQLQSQLPIQHMQTVSRTSGANLMGDGSGVGAGGGVTHMTVQHHHHQRPNLIKVGTREAHEDLSNTRDGNPLDALMYNGISNNFVGPNSPEQIPSSGYPICQQHHQAQPKGARTSANNEGWHISSMHQQQPQANYKAFTTYSSSRTDSVPIAGGRVSTQTKDPTITDERYMMP